MNTRSATGYALQKLHGLGIVDSPNPFLILEIAGGAAMPDQCKSFTIE